MPIPFSGIIAFSFFMYLMYIEEATFPQYHYIFTISNYGNKAVIVKNVTIDGISYLDHDVIIHPSWWVRPTSDIQREDMMHIVRVVRPQVQEFEMVTEENGQEVTYFCELTITKNSSRTFSIFLRDGLPLTSPLDSSEFLD